MTFDILHKDTVWNVVCVVSLRRTRMKSCWRPLMMFRKWTCRRCSRLNRSPGLEKTLTRSLVGPSVCVCVCVIEFIGKCYMNVRVCVCIALMMWITVPLTLTSLRPAAVPSLLSRWQRPPLCPGWAVDRPAWVPAWYVCHAQTCVSRVSFWIDMMSRGLAQTVLLRTSLTDSWEVEKCVF